MSTASTGQRLGGILGAVIAWGPARLLAVPPLLLATLALADALTGSGLIHTVLSPFCHQLPERSLSVAGHPMGLCSRCFSLYASFAAVLIVVPARDRLLRRIPEVPVWLVIAAAIPMAVDGGTQLIGLRESTNTLRVITGVLLGTGAAVFVAVAVNRAAAEARSRQEPEPPRTDTQSDTPAQTRAS